MIHERPIMVSAMVETKTIMILLGAFMLLAVSPALAGLSVTGSICDAEVTPGQHFEHEMIVSTDPEDRQMELQVDVMGFGRNLQGMNFEIDPDDDTSPYSARPFLQVSPRNFTLPPGGSQNVQLQGDIPAISEKAADMHWSSFTAMSVAVEKRWSCRRDRSSRSSHNRGNEAHQDWRDCRVEAGSTSFIRGAKRFADLQ